MLVGAHEGSRVEALLLNNQAPHLYEHVTHDSLFSLCSVSCQVVDALSAFRYRADQVMVAEGGWLSYGIVNMLDLALSIPCNGTLCELNDVSKQKRDSMMHLRHIVEREFLLCSWEDIRDLGQGLEEGRDELLVVQHALQETLVSSNLHYLELWESTIKTNLIAPHTRKTYSEWCCESFRTDESRDRPRSGKLALRELDSTCRIHNGSIVQ